MSGHSLLRLLGFPCLPAFRSLYMRPASQMRARSHWGPRAQSLLAPSVQGKVYAVVDHDQDQRADAVHTLAEGLFMPSGVAFRDGALYVAEVNRVLRYDDIEAHLGHRQPGRPRRLW